MNKFKALLAIALATSLVGCGYSSRDNEVVGQVKRVVNDTPLLCPNYHTVDVSMGVLREGVGNTSREDIWAVVPAKMVPQLKKLAESGAPVKVTYDVRRWSWCQDYFAIVSNVEAIK